MKATHAVRPRLLKLGAAQLRADELHLSIWYPAERRVTTLVSLGSSYDAESYDLADFPLTEKVLVTALPEHVLAADPAADPAEAALLTELGFRALLMVPVMHEQAVIGLMEAYRLADMGWTSSEISDALAYGRQLGALLSR